MDNNAQSLASPSARSNRGGIAPAAGRGDLIAASIASPYIKRSFDFLAPYGFAWRLPCAAVVQEVVPNRRALRTAAVIAVAFGMIASATSFALAGQCADTIKRIEAALDALTSNPSG